MKRRLSAFRAMALGLAVFASSCTNVDGERDGAPVNGGVDERSGTIGVRVLDDPGGSLTQYVLVADSGQRLLLEVDESIALANGERVTLAGALTTDGLFSVSSVERRISGLRADGPVFRTPTHHTVAVLAHADAGVSRAEALEALNAPVESAQHWFGEVSGGVDTFSGEVYRRYDVALTDNNCRFNNTDQIADAMVAAFEADGFDASDYDHIAVIVPRSCGSDWSGAWAYIGGIRDNGTPNFSRISMYKDDVFDPWFLGHELGHNLGMNHARSVDCGARIYETGGAGCSFSEYGNYNDIMGNGESVWVGAAYLRYIGWVGAANIVTAGAGATFNLQPADDSASCGIRAVRVPIPGENGGYFYVEYRRARGDSRYAGTGALGSNRRNAVLITRSFDDSGGNDSSYTDRIELDTSRYRGADVGERYDLGGGVAVTVEAQGGAVARVAVETPGTGAARDDNGNRVVAETNGTLGATSCGDDDDDQCPGDPNKPQPGDCGCGVPEGTCDRNPRIEMTKTSYETGEDIAVRFTDLPGNATDWVGLYRAGAADTEYVDYVYSNGASNGTARFSGREAGNYEARLFFNDSYDREARVRFTIAAPPDECPGDPNKTEPGECGCGIPEGSCEGPRIEMSKSRYADGEPIVVRFRDLPGNRFDWVGLYRNGSPVTDYLQYRYSQGATNGTMRFRGRRPGTYQARLFFDDSYDVELEISFTVADD